jgi:heme-degrading monooxygenase HmoA
VSDPQPFVVVSELAIAPEGADTLEAAFRDRLREVDADDGFLGLQVWRDRRDDSRFVMVSWWRDRDAWTTYMRSAAHDRSHARIPTDPAAPRGVGLGQFEVVAT